MIPTISRETKTVQPERLTLDGFLEHVRYSNPFEINRVVQVSAQTNDVGGIHERQYQRLQELAIAAQRQHLGIGAVLWGDPGIGKSHLLARLSRWAGGDNRQALFIYIANLQASPESLPRSLLRCIVSMLTSGRRRQFHETTLYRLVLAAIQRALRSDGTRKYPEAEAVAAYHAQIDSLAQTDPSQAAVVDRAVYEVLFRFWRSATLARQGTDDGIAGRAVRWLSGDFVDAEEAPSLGLPPRREGASLSDDQNVKMALSALAQLASWWQRPLILCFDQVDNLEEEQFAALARFLHALIDSAGNLLVITSGVQPTLLRWKTEKVITDSSWDRLAQYEIEVQPVNVSEARQIVQARLQPFQEALRALAPVWKLVQKDVLFPLGESWSQQALAQKMDLRPRDVMNWAREGWRREQEALGKLGGTTWLEGWGSRQRERLTEGDLSETEIQRRIDDQVAHKVQEHQQQRQLEPQALPPDADNLAGLLSTLLQRCLNAAPFASLRSLERPKAPKYGSPPPYQMMLRQLGPDGAEFSTGLSCLTATHKTALAGALRRMVQDTQPPKRLIVVIDERCPLNLAAAGREYLAGLRQRHSEQFQAFTLSFPAYAELDALQATVGLARSGDLEIELANGKARPVSEKEVIESHFRQQRYLNHPLLKLILGGAAATAAPVPPAAAAPAARQPLADDQDLRQFIMGRLGITMGMSSKELAVHYQGYLQKKRVKLDLPACKERLEEAARQLHQDGKVNATPHDDYLYLLLK